MKIIHSRLVIGLVLGVATGLIYGWIISPVEYINTAPDSLRADYRTDYVLMVAQAYAVEDDLELAPKRMTPPPPTRFPTSTSRPAVTSIPSATPGSPFNLESKEMVCDAQLAEPLIQVRVLDASGNEVPGLEILVVWDTGQDRFFTGLKPELGMGYGDFTMTPETTYTVQLAQADIPVTGLQSDECTDSQRETFPGSWLLVFFQPEGAPQP